MHQEVLAELAEADVIGPNTDGEIRAARVATAAVVTISRRLVTGVSAEMPAVKPTLMAGFGRTASLCPPAR